MNKMIIIGVISLVSVSGIFYVGDAYRKQPHTNPNPSESLIIKGHLDKRMPLTLYTSTYMAMNESCDRISNLLEGAYAPRTISFDYAVARTAGSHYELSIPMNKIQPGYCQWQLVDISYSLVKNDKGKQDLSRSLLRFNNNAKRTNNAKLTIQCQRDHDYLDGYDCDITTGNIDAFQISPWQQSITINFLNKTH